MGRLPRIACDVALATLATLCAICLRNDLDPDWTLLVASGPYLAVTAIVATFVVGASGLDLGFWRFASLIDIVKVIGVALVTTICAVAVVFAHNRLEGVARSIPLIQPVMIAVFLLAPRLIARARFNIRRTAARGAVGAPLVAPTENVVIVGMNAIAEVFLRALLETDGARISVAGVVCDRPRHVGRFLRQYPILGTYDDLERVMADLAVHGVDVRRLILTAPLESLTNRARAALVRLEAEQGVRIDPLVSRLVGLQEAPPRAAAGDAPTVVRVAPAAPRTLTALRPADLERIAERPYWRRKRAFDVAATVCAAPLLLPAALLVLIVVTIDLGWPPIFWQRRLGLGGATFRLYKFRTMAPAHDHRGLRIPEGDRLSAAGRLLRRTRLDELPQFWNVLVGDMSLTGPRPLLAADQPVEGADRLVVRPGLTGWAQVQGGRTVGPAEKAALDVWWIRNASLAIDLRILVQTARMALLGDRVNDAAVAEAQAAFDGAADLEPSARPPLRVRS